MWLLAGYGDILADSWSVEALRNLWSSLVMSVFQQQLSRILGPYITDALWHSGHMGL